MFNKHTFIKWTDNDCCKIIVSDLYMLVIYIYIYKYFIYLFYSHLYWSSNVLQIINDMLQNLFTISGVRKNKHNISLSKEIIIWYNNIMLYIIV